MTSGLMKIYGRMKNGRCANVYDISITSAIPLILNHIHTQTDQVDGLIILFLDFCL